MPVKFAKDFEAQEMAWLWQSRIPMGNISCIFGMPGTGKSQLACLLAAQASRGELEGQFHGKPVNVLMSSQEDSITMTVRPRLEAAGADLNRVVLAEEALLVPEDTDELERIIVEHDIRLVILDPLMAHLGPKAAAGSDQKIRQAFGPLVKMIEKHQCAIVFISHPTKAKGKVNNALDLLGGSRGIGGAFRSVMYFGADPDAADEGRLLAMTKNNLAAFPETIAFLMEEYEMKMPTRFHKPGTMVTVNISRLVEAGVSKRSDLDMINVDPKNILSGAARKDKCRILIGNMLAYGPVAANDVLREAKDQGFSEKMARSAAKDLGVVITKSGFQGASMWDIPVEDDDDDDQDSNPSNLTIPADWDTV